jgi:hypothetical protein
MLLTHSTVAFACLSKVCAPPPVGRGGSLRSKVGGRPADVAGEVGELRSFFDPDLSPTLTKFEANRRVVGEMVRDESFLSWFEKNKDRHVSEIEGMKRVAMEMWDKFDFENHKNGFTEIVRRRDPSVTDNDEALRVATLGELAEAWSLAHRYGASDRFGSPDYSPAMAIAEMFVRSSIDAWAEDATGGMSAIYQIAASKVHKTSVADYRNSPRRKSMETAMAFWLKNSTIAPVAEAVVRAEYAATQKWLAEKGIKSLTVWRGVGVPRADAGDLGRGDTVKLSLNPLSSWAGDRSSADQFSRGANRGTDVGVSVVMEVPASMVQSLPFTGRGCLFEWEVVLINRPSTATVVKVFQ